jgi:hypothetical protein
MQKQFIAILFFTVLLMHCTPKSDVKKQQITKTTYLLLANSVDSLANQYLLLKDAFVSEDSTKINTATANLINQSNIDTVTLTKDNTKKSNLLFTYKEFNLIVTVLSNQSSIINKRKIFKDLTKPMQQILRSSNSNTMYIQHCPMAAEYSADENVYWISKDGADNIKNPFFPKTMLRCGNVTDTLSVVK